MYQSTIARRTGLALAALTMTFGLAACGSSDDNDPAASEPTPSATQDTMTDEASMPFGPACDSLPKTGPGSAEQMATEPVATAASGSEMLSTLVTAVTEADLVETLNGAEDITVFAPSNDAFAEIPEADLDALLADKDALTKVLMHHVVEGTLTPENIEGEHMTLNGDMITISGSGEMWAVADEEAGVLCGNVSTANAKVYVIDTVLMP